MQDEDLTLESVPGFQRPMSANPNDRVVGEDELGRRIYETVTGQRYTISLNPDQRTARTQIEEDFIPAMQEYFENPTLPTASQAAGFVGDVARGAYESLESAVEGRGTLGDVAGLAVGSGAGSMFGEVPEGALRVFGGFNAARDPGMDVSGKALPRSVGAEGLPRFEINDSVATYNPQNLIERDFSGRRLNTVDWDMVNAYPGRFFPTLDEVIDHPELFRQYPELANVNVVIDTSLPQTDLGYYHPKINLIAVSRNTADDSNLFAETLLHEIQHGVQKREGFDQGTNPDSAIVSRRQASEIAQFPYAEEDLRYLGYYGKSGEVESRNVGDRRGLTLEERFERPPVRTESVNRGSQWIVDESGNIKDAVNLFGTDEENRGGFLRRLGNFLRGRRSSQYNAGGVVSMEEQMSLFDMGGLADDGAMRDPVSGNEVPPGSMASEVRDDVPAMLSEGEYIVPADVVRYYGVKFFEELRGQAKQGLMDMDRNGRIGGEPVDAPMGGDELSPEEMQMLAELTGMYAGGDVKRPAKESMSVEELLSGNMSIYDAINSPVRVYTPSGMEATTPEMKRELFERMGLIQVAEASGMYKGGMVQQGYQTGGMVPSITQGDFMQQGQKGSQFQLPPSIFAPSAPPQPGAVFAPITLYGPSGEPMVATSQEEYNNLIAQGYTTQPRVTQPLTEASGGGGGGGIEEPQVTGGGAFRLNDEKLEALRSNPLGFGSEALQGGTPMGLSSRQMAGAGTLVGGMPGMIAGGLAGAAFELDNIAQAKAALEIARSQELEGTDAFKKLETDLASAIKNLSGPARMLERLGLGSGNSYIEQARAQTAAPAAAPATARVPVASSGTTSAPVSDAGLGRAQSMTESERSAGMEYAATGSDRAQSWTGGAVASNQTAPSTSRTSEQARSSAQAAADRQGTTLATGGRATGGLVAKRKKPVAKKK